MHCATREGARLIALAKVVTAGQFASLRSLVSVNELKSSIVILVNGSQVSTHKGHPILENTLFLPAFQEAVARMEHVQRTCDKIVNNGCEPSDEFVQAMKLLWRQPLHLSPTLPRSTISFPTITDFLKPLEMHIHIPCF